MRFLATLIACLFMLSAAHAASVEPKIGQVYIDSGNGFVPVGQLTPVEAGTVVMVTQGSVAKIWYDGCWAKIEGPQTVRISAESACAAGTLQGSAPASQPVTGMGALGTTPVIVGGILVAGGVAAAIAIANRDNDDKPASP